MFSDKQSSLDRLIDAGVVAVVRAQSVDQLPAIAEALLTGGIIAIEITLTTPDAIAGIAALARRFSHRALLGVGTVLDEESCRQAIAAGAQFVVSPMFDEKIVAATLELDRIAIPGGFTPSEILRASAAGADIVKVFPSNSLGPGYFKDLLAPLPDLKLMPTGGVDLSNLRQWFQAGATCVGVGSSLVSWDDLAKNDWSEITAAARTFVAATRAARSS
jgi:2-dehydro-3-deoxyphosphogluconate aldolase / (4S)-4-hydroxy-2-oxoglutarate aldolase